MVACWRYSPDAQWLRCEGSINEQQIRTGGGKTTAISMFSSPASTLSGQENRSGESRANVEVGLLLKGGLKGNKERRVHAFAHLVPIYSWQL